MKGLRNIKYEAFQESSLAWRTYGEQRGKATGGLWSNGYTSPEGSAEATLGTTPLRVKQNLAFGNFEANINLQVKEYDANANKKDCNTLHFDP